MTASAHLPADEIRDLLYGDVPLDRWALGNADFDRVRAALAGGDRVLARRLLRAVLASGDRPSRDYLQAWHELRALGDVADDPAHLYGVVVDMPVGDGRDTLAAYEDWTCRYLNYSGRVLVWESRRADVDEQVTDLLSAGAAVVARIGPWDGPRPVLRPNLLRLSFLCAGGLYYGEGPASGLGTDPMAGPVVAAATRLMRTLTSGYIVS